MKKQIIALLLVIFVFVIPSSSYANAKAITPTDDITIVTSEKLLDTLLLRQFEGLVSGESVDASELFVENDITRHYQLFLKWRIEQAVAVGTTYDKYNYEIVDIVSSSSTTLVATVNAEYYYLNSPYKYGQADIIYTITAVDTKEGTRISFIDTNEVMYSEFSQNILSISDVQKSYDSAKQIVSDSIDDLYVLDKLMEQSFAEQTNSVTNDNIEDTPSLAALSSYSYNASTGVAYANKYYKNRNLYFYDAGVDCTNFVSQCIWAAYGGWSTSDSDATMQSNITAKKRMMNSTYLSNWFAGSGGGGTPWESVNGLWNFVTSSPSEGPKATGYNNNNPYYYLDAPSIQAGNVLQVRTSSGAANDYSHSVYVIYAVGLNDWNEIGVAQHTSNVTRSVADLVSGWGGTNCYMRRLVFTSANFSR